MTHNLEDNSIRSVSDKSIIEGGVLPEIFDFTCHQLQAKPAFEHSETERALLYCIFFSGVQYCCDNCIDILRAQISYILMYLKTLLQLKHFLV